MSESFKPERASDLTEDQKTAALKSLMFLKEKRDGTIKGCSVADGRKQRDKPNEKYASSPTVSLEAVLITAVLDAYEHRDVAIVDTPGDYMSAYMAEEVHLCLR